jgi:phage-related protein
MRQYFTYDGRDSRDFGVYISGQGTFKSPARAYNMISVPGRNGDLVGIENRLENVEITYPAFIYTNFESNVRALRNYLLSKLGYCRLWDTYNFNEYRRAVYRGGLEPDVLQNNKAGSFDITFDCEPQRYLITGETATTLTASGSIYNPTLFPSRPLLRVYGTGILGIGSQSITLLSGIGSWVEIDCEIMEAYQGTVSKNAYIQLSSYKFPELVPGANNISLGSGITRVVITPRWWEV